MTISKMRKEPLVQDLISSLPEALLTRILSFLETKKSVQTSVLSTRWRYLFAYVPVLDFRIPYPYPKPKEFVKFVNRVLSLHDVSCTIRIFRINMGLNPCTLSDVSSWIDAAIRRKAQIIDFNVAAVPSPWPTDLFTSQFLVHLRLCSWLVVDVTGPVSLPCLKTIHFTCCKFSNADSAMRLFSNCPVLEKLHLWRCQINDVNAISISVPSLKHMVVCISDVRNGGYYELTNVPKLEVIELFGNCSTFKCSSVNILKSLRKAVIFIYGKDYDIGQLINKFAEVQILSLSGDLESLGRDSFSPPMFNKLTTLRLRVDFFRGWKFFQILLESSSCLEDLTIEGVRFSNWNQEILEIDIFFPTRIPLCFSRSLKKVQVNMFKGKNVEYELLGYLLKNAEVLEKLAVITFSVVEGGKDFAYSERVRQNLLAFPRGSKNCQIVVL